VRSARQRTATAAIAVTLLAAGGALAYTAWKALFPRDPGIDCAGYAFPT